MEDICHGEFGSAQPLCSPSTRGDLHGLGTCLFTTHPLETMVVIRLPSSTPKHGNSAERDGSRGAGHESCIASYSWSMTIVFLQGPISDMVFMVFYNLIF